MIKSAKRYSHQLHGQHILIFFDAKGRHSIHVSEAFQSRHDAWFPQSLDFLKEGSEIAVAVANEIRSRKRSEGEQNGQRAEGKAGEGQGVIDNDDDDFGDDAEHEDDDGHTSGFVNTNDGSIPKHLIGYATHPPPPPIYESSPPRIRKRTLPTAKSVPKRRCRPSTKASPIQKFESNAEDSKDAIVASGPNLTPLMIGDVEAITAFFETRFRQMQQLTCKVVAKAWIKVIEPKKQSNFPYNRGDESKPSWWPTGARHKEPDHLMKPGRPFMAR